ncbi:MAG: hypothetical protein ACE5I3_01470 [Phycisphaerae bacterium]
MTLYLAVFGGLLGLFAAGDGLGDEPDRGGDPRKVLIGDVTGDEIDDIVLLVHDRLIVYPGQ